MLCLYNPTAGKGRVTADLAAVLDVFTKAGYLTTVYPTQGKADATRIAAELGTTPRAVEGRLYRIRKRLQEQLGGDAL